MKSFTLTAYGQPPALTDRPCPEPGPAEVRLRIAACGLNFADLLMIEGRYQERPALPLTLGMEVAGVVDALGPGVAGPVPGTRVLAFANSGGLAEAGCFPAAHCLRLPESMDFVTAAGFAIAYGTSHLALSRAARLVRGETLAVLGAAGGVGLTAVEIGHRLGARVIAVARGAERLAATKGAGADILIDSEAGDLVTALRAAGGADVVFDPVGGAGFDAALRATRPGGRILTIGFASGTVPQIAANHLLVKNIAVIGFYWAGYLGFDPGALTASLKTLLGWHAEGGLVPHISHRLPLARAAEALDLIRQRKATGKVVVTI